jgi:serine/threonine protein kinase
MDLTPFHGPPATTPQVPGFAARTLLGFGAHGEVWLAEDLSTGGSVALKVGRRVAHDPVVPTGVAPDRAGASTGSAEQETALLCRIDHPHIVRLQRVVPLDGGGLALVLDFASGGSLASLVAARGPLDPGEVTTLLIPLAGALEHLHRKGVVHADIAPGNVLLTADGRPQLGDLGVARVLGSRAADVWATPGFTDPALTAGHAPVDARAADRWSLAAVGWFALTGRAPEPDVVPMTDGSQTSELSQLLAECLVADPARRPGLDELADRAWQAARPTPIRLISERGSAGVEVGLPPLSSRVTRPASRSGTVIPDGESVAQSRTMPARGVDPVVRSGAGRLWPGSHRSPGEHRLATRFRGTVSSRRAAGAVAVAGLAAVGLGVVVVVGAIRPVNPGSSGPVTARSTQSASTPTGAAPIDLDVELSQALVEIGRSRAEAFAHASAATLAEADQQGSPAYQADLTLVRRLSARGFRLEGVRYQVEGVHVLRHRGNALDVAAVVTTSVHRQVAVASKLTVPVPEDGPRSLVFTVVPLVPEASGPARWRIQSIAAAS